MNTAPYIAGSITIIISPDFSSLPFDGFSFRLYIKCSYLVLQGDYYGFSNIFIASSIRL